MTDAQGKPRTINANAISYVAEAPEGRAVVFLIGGNAAGEGERIYLEDSYERLSMRLQTL